MVYVIYGTLLKELWKTVEVSTEVMAITSIEEENHLLLKGLALDALEFLAKNISLHRLENGMHFLSFTRTVLQQFKDKFQSHLLTMFSAKFLHTLLTAQSHMTVLVQSLSSNQLGR